VAGRLAFLCPEHAGQVHGMHARFGGEIADPEALRELRVKAVLHAAEPRRRRDGVGLPSREGTQHLQQMALGDQGIGRPHLEGREHPQPRPQHRAGPGVDHGMARKPHVERLQEVRAALDGEEPGSGGPDPGAVPDAGRVEDGGERRELGRAPRVVFGVVAAEHHRDVREGMLVARHGAGLLLRQLRQQKRSQAFLGDFGREELAARQGAVGGRLRPVLFPHVRLLRIPRRKGCMLPTEVACVQ
jgi:hypothetical protein